MANRWEKWQKKKQWQTLFSCPKLLQMVTEALKSGEIWCWRGLLRVSWTARKSNQDWCWGWNFNTLATWCEELTHWKRPWIWVRLKVGGEGNDREWDGWIASLTLWTWVWVNSGSWWWTGRPSVLQPMGSQRVGHDWETDLIWSDLIWWDWMPWS